MSAEVAELFSSAGPGLARPRSPLRGVPSDDSPAHTVALTELRPHPLNAEVFTRPHGDEDVALADDIRREGLLRPIIVCGDGCASPRGTILAGHRRVRAAERLGIARVAVTFRDGLSADEEEWQLLLDNRADQRTRNVRHSELFAMEDRLRELHGKRQDQRTHLAGDFGHNDRSSGGRRNTNAILAELTGEASSAIKNRRTFFTSPITSDAVRQAVDDDGVALTRAATALRRLMADPAVRRAFEGRDPVGLAEAQARLDQELLSPAEPKAPAWHAFVKRALRDIETGEASRAAAGLRELLASVGATVDAGAEVAQGGET